MKAFPPFRLDLVNQCLWRTGSQAESQRILLTPKAFAVLRFLVDHAGRLVTQEELLEALWPNTFVQQEVLKSHIRDIRAALGDDSKNPVFIETLPRRGYQFIAPVTEVSSQSEVESESQVTRVVGRTRELARLKLSLKSALHGERQLLFVTGEAGIGKTTLVDEFQRVVATSHPALRIARGQCVEGFGGKEPYYPMLEALGHLCQGGRQDSVVEILTSHAPTWLAQFPALMKRDQREKLQREIVGATRERMLREIADALEAIAAESPLALVLEDLHWVDPSTVDLMSVLARRRQPAKLLLIGPYRPVDVLLTEHPLKALKQDLLVHHLCHEIALEPLMEAEVVEYLKAQTGGASLPNGLAALIYRHSEGNPLFMVAALNHMRDRGLVVVEDESLRLTVPIETIDLEAPESLRQMIELQFDRLSRDELRALEVLSVLRKFSLSVAMGAAVADIEPEEFEEIMEGLARRHQIVRPAGFRDYQQGGSSPCYEFVHVLYRQVLYGRIGAARRKKLHKSVGEHSEGLSLLAGPELATEQAYQFEEGADWPRAIKYLQLAADTAGRRFEPKQAAQILERALELTKRLADPDCPVKQGEILQKLGAVYVAGFDPRAIQVYEALVELAVRNGDVEMEVRSLLAMALPLAWSHADSFLETVNRALELCSRQQEPKRVKLRTTCLLWRLGTKWNLEDAEECRRAYTDIRATGDPLELLSAVDWCYFHFNSSQYEEARRCAVEGFSAMLKESEENPYMSGTYSLYQQIIFKIHLFLGKWGDALRETEATIATVARNGNSVLSQLLGSNRALVHLQGQDFASVSGICEPIMDLTAWPGLHRYCKILLGCADVGQGAYDSALNRFLTARNDMKQHPLMDDWYSRMQLQLGLVDAWLAKGDFQNAQMEGAELLKVTLTTEERTWRALSFEANARVAIVIDDLPKANDFIAQSLREMEGYELPLAAWRVHAAASRICKALGDAVVSEKHSQASREVIAKLANSLPADEPLRSTFLAAPAIRSILVDGLVGAESI